MSDNHPPSTMYSGNGYNPFPKNLVRSTASSYPPPPPTHAGMRGTKTFSATPYTPTMTSNEKSDQKKKDIGDGWGEAKEDEKEEEEKKLDWSEMSVHTPIMTKKPEIGDTVSHVKGDSINSNPSIIPAGNFHATTASAEDDGGWLSGNVTGPSPPSQPFHSRGQSRRYPSGASQYREGRPTSFSSQPAGEDRPNSRAQVTHPYQLSLTPSHMHYHGQFNQPPVHPALQPSRGFRNAISGALGNPPIVTPAYPQQPINRISAAHTQLAVSEAPQPQVPTYTDPIVGPPRQQIAGLHDANRIPVSHAKQWGKSATPEQEGRYEDASAAMQTNNVQPQLNLSQPPENPMWSEIGDPAQASWDKDDRLARWANNVRPIPPSHQATPHTSVPPSEADATKAEEEIETFATVETPEGNARAVTLEYSPGGEERTPALTPHGTASPPQEESEIIDPASAKAKAEKPPAVLGVAAEGHELPSTPPSNPVDSSPHGPRGRLQNGVGRSWNSRKTHWWKRPPHPMFSPQYAAQRILVQLPFPVRTDNLKQLMSDQFSRYGEIHSVFHFEPNGNFCEKAFVVFKEKEAVKKVFSDPESRTWVVKSSRIPGSNPVELVIKHSSPHHLSRTVLIRITGPRVDARARSASPKPARPDTNDEETFALRDQLGPYHRAPLPARIYIDAVPALSRDGRSNFRAKIRPRHISFKQLYDQAKEETGKDMTQIGELDLRRRVPEKDIIPVLCDYFAEVCDISPPTAKGQGWLVTVGGIQDARHLMDEISKIPGFFARWADEGDGYDANAEAEVPPSVTTEPVTPITRVRNEMEGRSSAANRRTPFPMSEDVNNATENVESQHPSYHLPPPEPFPSAGGEGPIATPLSQPIPQYAYPPSGYSPNHPNLRRTILHTYKGRPLIQDMSSDEERFIDERAIFVGRLVKHVETSATLLKRFNKYGTVSTIEYNPSYSAASYATARILYQDKESADRAIAHENGSVSFGSSIKVEVRKVLSNDVQFKEMYIDDSGRAISPSMVSQYSPASATLQAPHFLPAMDHANQHPVPALYPGMMPPAHFGMWFHPPSMIPTPYPVPTPMHPSSAPTGNAVESALSITPPYMDSQNPSQIPSNMQLPMLCAAWGIGYLPPGALPFPFAAPTPATGNEDAQSVPPAAPVPGPDLNPEASSVESPIELPDGLSSRSRLNPIGFTNEDGMLKPVYDPKDLKDYCAENKITLPKGADPLSMVKQEEVTLLPIQSGGHDHAGPDQPVNSLAQGTPLSPKFASINDPPRVNNVGETRTVPVPILFSPVEPLQPLPDQQSYMNVSDTNGSSLLSPPPQSQVWSTTGIPVQNANSAEPPLFTNNPLPLRPDQQQSPQHTTSGRLLHTNDSVAHYSQPVPPRHDFAGPPVFTNDPLASQHNSVGSTLITNDPLALRHQHRAFFNENFSSSSHVPRSMPAHHADNSSIHHDRRWNSPTNSLETGGQGARGISLPGNYRRTRRSRGDVRNTQSGDSSGNARPNVIEQNDAGGW
ncbi:hypothetical protein V865_002787 [Kwoniella europaea PYCC6329]|uniref:RRM domain-containing protein n=1 Tax=Kwoniella europaea PYCC6329 TaxID=1423913 RepID=A0AAX4KDY3_9TREE